MLNSDFNRMINPPKILSIKTYENCYALPIRYLKTSENLDVHGGGLCHDGIWIKESGLFLNSLTAYDFDSEDVKYVDDDVVFIGYISPVWGHAITDCLKHLWWLNTEEYQENHKGKELYYWGPKPLFGNFLELVRLAGVDVAKLHFIDQKLLFRSVIVPDISFNYTEGWACKEYLETIDLIITNVRPCCDKKVDKVFLSEREGRRNWGVRSIEKVARQAGFKIYYPGEHPLQEQISVFRSASVVMSFESSIGHNTVFCRPNTKLIMLKKANYVNKYQAIINEIGQFNVTVIDANLSVLNDDRYPYGGPFFVYPNDSVCQVIAETTNSKSQDSFFSITKRKQENINLFPTKTFNNYLRYLLWDDENTLSHRLVISDQYAKIISHEITKYREQQYKRINSFVGIFLLPQSLKEKIVRKLVKHKVRHLI